VIRSFQRFTPEVHATAFVEETACVIGEVRLAAGVSVWFQAVLRGDVGPIVVGERTNIQDGCVVHCTRGKFVTTIGADVTVGHRAILHGCTIADRVLVGMGAIVMDGVAVGEDVLIAAGALVSPGTKVPPRSLVIGSPARVKRPLTDAEVEQIRRSAASYIEYARLHRERA
jgi:carbonic anhydrase/acetyltransferase-like protein (isoleucine patch superfamily)